MEAAICTSGCAMRASRAFEAMATPTGTVQRAPRMSAALTRRKVSAALSRSSIAEDEHFAGHQKKPAAGDGHHGIPDQTNGGKRKVKFGETLPAAETIDDRGFVEFARNGFQ
jgi:hypothetical protein